MTEEIHVESHESLIKTPKQLVIVVFLAFAVPIALIVLLSQYVTGGLRVDASNPQMSEDAIARRIKPAGEVVLGEAPPPPPAVTPARRETRRSGRRQGRLREGLHGLPRKPA